VSARQTLIEVLFFPVDFVLVLSEAVIVLVIEFPHIGTSLDYEYEHELGCGQTPAL